MHPLILISSLATGGAERVTVSFLCHEKIKKSEVLFCTVTDRHDSPLSDELSKNGVIRYDLSARRLADPFALLRLIMLIRRERIDIVHAHGQDASILAAIAKRFLNVPLVITRHVLVEPSENWRQRLRAWFALAAIRSANAVVAVSSAVADRLADTAHLKRSDIRIIPNGIEIEKFNRPELKVHRQDFRTELGFGPKDHIVLVPAVLRKGKGHEVLLQSIPAIRSRIPTAYVLIAGSGECEDELRFKARSLGNAVIFLGERDDIPKLLTACDLVVLPSIEEALPTVLIEAAAASLPVLATCVWGVKEVVAHDRTGILVPPNDPIDLGEAVVKILSNHNLARKFGEEAYKLAHERFSIDLQIEKTLELWSDVIKGSSR